MPEDKKPGAIKKTAKYLISPRVFMNAEDVKKYGSFSLSYHKDIISAIRKSFASLKDSSQQQKAAVSVQGIEQRLLMFYDTLYESSISEDGVTELHTLQKKRAKMLFSAAAFTVALSILLFVAPNYTIIPNWVIGVATATVSATIALKAFMYNYYAWLIEQRLVPELFSFKRYLEKPITRWPKKALSETMIAEIKAEYKKRDDELRNYLANNTDKSLADIGMEHFKERLGE